MVSILTFSAALVQRSRRNHSTYWRIFKWCSHSIERPAIVLNHQFRLCIYLEHAYRSWSGVRKKLRVHDMCNTFLRRWYGSPSIGQWLLRISWELHGWNGLLGDADHWVVRKVLQHLGQGNSITLVCVFQKKLMHIVDSSRRYHLQWKIGYPIPQLENSER